MPQYTETRSDGVSVTYTEEEWRAKNSGGSLLTGIVLICAVLYWIFKPDAPSEPVPSTPSKHATTAAFAPATPIAPIHACESLTQCFSASIGASRNRDATLLDSVAARVETFSKPEPGDRVLARRLNEDGLKAFRSSDFAQAIEHFKAANDANPRDAEIASNLGIALVNGKRPKEALAVLVAALPLEPRRVSTWSPIALAHADLGNGKDALAAGWIALHWSTNKEKSLAMYRSRASSETDPRRSAYFSAMVTMAEELCGD